MKREIIVCDQCGIEKKDTNHWFMVDVASDAFSIYTWTENLLYKHYCGEKCVSIAFSAWADRLKPKSEVESTAGR